MRIALYGIGGTYNFGCEAIVRGTEKIIHETFKDAVIDYYSYDAEADLKRLEKVNVNIIPLLEKNVKTLIYKCLVKFELLVEMLTNKHIKCFSNWLMFGWISSYDYILSIGGDIYTLPPVSEKCENKIYTNSLLDFGEYCKKKNKKLIIWGASIGPFDECKSIKKVFFGHFNKCIHHISVREPASEKYLRDNKYKSFSFYGDPAFVVKSDVTHPNIKKENAIGINLSPLSNNYLSSDINLQDRIQMQCETISAIAKKFQKKIILFPHVFSQNITDDDFSYQEKIYTMLKGKGIDIEIIKCNGFLEVKENILKCDLIVSARMHCAINALASLVPAIFLSYSEKSKGMCKLVYGTDKYVLSVDDFNDSTKVIPLISDLLEYYKNNENDFIKNISRIKKSAYNSSEILND